MFLVAASHSTAIHIASAVSFEDPRAHFVARSAAKRASGPQESTVDDHHRACTQLVPAARRILQPSAIRTFGQRVGALSADCAI